MKSENFPESQPEPEPPEGREVDFVALRDGRPTRFVECKASDLTISPSLLYLVRRFPTVEAVQVVARRGIDRIAAEGVRLVSADTFLGELAI